MATSQSGQSILTALEEALAPSPSATAAPAKERWRPIVIVVSPRPGSGKTFLARLLTDFFSTDYGEVEAFDLGAGDHMLVQYRQRKTRRCSLESTEDQIALFDRLVAKDRIAKVVDVGHEWFPRFFRIVEETGFLEETRGRAIELVVLYAADAHPTCPQAFKFLQQRFPEMVLVPVFNDGILRGQNVRNDYAITRAASVPLHLPMLPPSLKTFVDNTESTFAEFHDFLPIAVPMGPAMDLRAWTRRTFAEFRELELRFLMDKLRTSLADAGSLQVGDQRD